MSLSLSTDLQLQEHVDKHVCSMCTLIHWHPIRSDDQKLHCMHTYRDTGLYPFIGLCALMKLVVSKDNKIKTNIYILKNA